MLLKIIQAISYVCNCNCDYCMNHGLQLDNKEVPIEDLINFYQELFERNKNIIIDFTITGGEPFHPLAVSKTIRLLEYLYSLDIIEKVRINTNGYYSIPDICKNSKSLIQFSIDGDEEYCDTISHKKGLYQNMIKNLEYCRENNISYQTRTVVTEDNFNRIENVIQLAKKYGHTAFIQACRAGGKSNNQEILDNLRMTYQLRETYGNKTPFNIEFVKSYNYCSFMNNRDAGDGVAILVNPFGQIGACAFLATTFMSQFNIYNFFDITLAQYKIIQHRFLKDATCCFPKGYQDFYSHLTIEEKEEVNKIKGVCFQ